MKVENVKKECSAIVGLSIEFSNSEIASLSRLLWEVDAVVEKAVDQQIKMMKTFKQGQHNLLDAGDNVPAAIDLKTLKKIQWLLYMMSRTDHSGLFDYANREYENAIKYINDSVSGTKA